MLRGNKILYPKSGSNAQHGSHDHIFSKMLKNLLQNSQADFHETGFVVFGTPAHRNLYK